MKQQRIPFITVLLFFSVIGVFSVWNVLAPKTAISWNENRTLASVPELSASHIFGGRFDDDFETWFSDHFFARDTWIELKSFTKKATLSIENNDIYFASDGRLVSRFAQADDITLSSNIEQIESFANDQAITPNVLLVPTAAWGAASSLPLFAWDIDQETLLQTIEQQMPSVTMVSYPSVTSPDPHLYFKTDHHWNEQGAYLGYVAICQQVLHKEPNSFTFTLASTSFQGTMVSKSGAFHTAPDPIYTIVSNKPVEAETLLDDGAVLHGVYSESRLSEKDQYSYYVDGNHAREDIHTDLHNGRRAVLIKDSYSHILVPYLITEYEDLILLDLRYYHAPVSDVLEEGDDVYFIYSLDNFSSDPSLAFLR
ncbi:MAG: hypothetical protein IJ225_06350 [Solobacterium sp.]|nr:hypothetical protein [Solobacterium sp.]